MILSSNRNPVNCTQDKGAELKGTLGRGSWPTPPAVHSAVGMATRGSKSRKLRAPPCHTAEQKPANDKGKSQPAEMGQRPPKSHRHVKGRSRDPAPPQPGRTQTRRPHRHLGCSSRYGTRRNWFLSTTASRAAAAISAQPRRTPKAARRSRESVPRLASLLTAVGHRCTES